MKKLGWIVLFYTSLGVASEGIVHEFSPAVSFYTGDSLRSSVNGSFSYVFHLNRSFWFGADFTGGRVVVDQPNTLSLTTGDRFYGFNGAFYYNIPALLGAAKVGDDGLRADMYTSAGIGNFWIGPHSEIFGFVGGGMLLHTGMKWLAFRFDLRGNFFGLSNNGGSDFYSDLALSLGPTFLID